MGITTSLTVSSIKPDLTILGSYQRFIFDQNNSTFSLYNIFTPTENIGSKMNIEFRNNLLNGFNLTHETSKLDTIGSISLLSFLNASTVGINLFTIKTTGVTFAIPVKGLEPVTDAEFATKLYVDNKAGGVTSVGITSGSGIEVTGSPITSKGVITVGLAKTDVSAGSYTNANLTINEQGQVTKASNGSSGGTVTLTDAITGTGAIGTPIATSLNSVQNIKNQLNVIFSTTSTSITSAGLTLNGITGEGVNTIFLYIPASNATYNGFMLQGNNITKGTANIALATNVSGTISNVWSYTPSNLTFEFNKKVDMNGNAIVNLQDGVNPQDAATVALVNTKGTVKSVIAGENLSGGTITDNGTISLNKTLTAMTSFAITGGPTINSTGISTPNAAFNLTNTAATGNTTIDSTTLTIQSTNSANSPLMVIKAKTSGSVSITTPATVSNPYVLTLPSSSGSSNQFLNTNGSGILSWATPNISGIVGMVSTQSSVILTIPAGITKCKITAIGGGGGGGGSAYVSSINGYNTGSGGGAGGTAVSFIVNLTPLQTLNITIGNGGNGGVNGSPGAYGANGGTTSVSGTGFTTVTGSGGFGGQTGNGYAYGGNGGPATGGTIFNLNGQTGSGNSQTISNSAAVSGGDGGGSIFPGACGGIYGGSSSFNPGGGGGGAGGGSGTYGGNGGNGMVIIEYYN